MICAVLRDAPRKNQENRKPSRGRTCQLWRHNLRTTQAERTAEQQLPYEEKNYRFYIGMAVGQLGLSLASAAALANWGLAFLWRAIR